MSKSAILSFTFNVKDCKNQFTLAFNPSSTEGNWSWRVNNNPEKYFSLDYQQSMVIFKSNRAFWSQLFKLLTLKPMRLGLEVSGPHRLEKKIALNYFGWANRVRVSVATLADLCKTHIGGEDYHTCFNCGAPYDEEAEEVAEAELCDCGFPEEECECPPCRNCGKSISRDECKCIICDECNLCACKKESHAKYHRPCDCETPCPYEERSGKHKRKQCLGHELPCDDCKKLECACSVSQSDEYDFY